MRRPIALVDLDNCISDDKWRWHMFELHRHLPNDRYWRYHSACEGDLHENVNVVRDLRLRYDLIITTSRPEVVRTKTMRWLKKWAIPAVEVYMRPNDNHEPSTVLKRQMLDAIRINGHDVQYAIDDRIDILDMYADEGVRMCRRVFINEPEIIHP